MRLARLMVAPVLAVLAAPLAAEAQPAEKMPRIGWLSLFPRSDSWGERGAAAFRHGLRDLGYVEGRTIAIEYRWAEERPPRLPDLAAELVHLKVDVIVALGAQAAQAAKQATATIPIVMVAVTDPVTTGLVATVARPGGNITGTSLIAPELVGKQLELLKEVVPTVSRVAVLSNLLNPGNAPQLREAEVAARALRLRLQPLEVREPGGIDRAFEAMRRERADAVLVLSDVMFSGHGQRIADLATKGRLAVVYGHVRHAETGGLIVYAVDVFDLYGRTSTYVDKILKGAKPADLPVQQPTKFELIINLKTAKTLGLTIPPSVLARADEVVQ
jgi:putative tryptophan/tyrosine transport system substrate-binding protein